MSTPPRSSSCGKGPTASSGLPPALSRPKSVMSCVRPLAPAVSCDSPVASTSTSPASSSTAMLKCDTFALLPGCTESPGLGNCGAEPFGALVNGAALPACCSGAAGSEAPGASHDSLVAATARIHPWPVTRSGPRTKSSAVGAAPLATAGAAGPPCCAVPFAVASPLMRIALQKKATACASCCPPKASRRTSCTWPGRYPLRVLEARTTSGSDTVEPPPPTCWTHCQRRHMFSVIGSARACRSKYACNLVTSVVVETCGADQRSRLQRFPIAGCRLVRTPCALGHSR